MKIVMKISTALISFEVVQKFANFNVNDLRCVLNSRCSVNPILNSNYYHLETNLAISFVSEVTSKFFFHFMR